MTDSRRSLPSVDRLLDHPRLAAAREAWARRFVVGAAREALDAARATIARGESPPDEETIATRLAGRLERLARPRPRPVINATGVIVHTNLGRAPLSEGALAEVAAASAGYADLEFDVASGGRGNRHAHVDGLLKLLFPGRRALVVNNNAAALLLALNTLARGREVIISRGELVEIGGSFRVPEIMDRSGATLVEVGTTNRTHARDYRGALTEQTGMLLRVWPSNYRVVGFTKEVSVTELAAIAREAGRPLVVDQGCGRLSSGAAGPDSEIPVDALLEQGADLVCFSGDKLLGGPQAGILVGEPEIVAACAKNPLARALRPGKLTIAALSATLRAAMSPGGARAESAPPAMKMMERTEEELAPVAEALAARLSGVSPRVRAECSPGASKYGGGAAPGEEIPTRLVRVAVEGLSESRLLEALRAHDVPIVARIDEGSVVLDPRTLLEGDADELERAMRALVDGAG